MGVAEKERLATLVRKGPADLARMVVDLNDCELGSALWPNLSALALCCDAAAGDR